MLEQWEHYVDLAHRGLREESLERLRCLADEMTRDEADRLAVWYCGHAFRAVRSDEVGMNAVIAQRLLLPALQRRAGRGEPSALLWLVLLMRDPAAQLRWSSPALFQRSWWVGLLALALVRNPESALIWRLLHGDEIYEVWYGTHHLLSDEALVLPLKTCQLALHRARQIEARAPAGVLDADAIQERHQLDVLLQGFVRWHAAGSAITFRRWLDLQRTEHHDV